MKNVILKDSVKEIKNTFKRFLSILLVVLLGVGFFAGIKATSPDMKRTIDEYFDSQNVMDIQVMSTLGLTQADIETLKAVESVDTVEGSYSQDVIVTIDEEEAVIKLETLTENLNQLLLLEGKMPESKEECVVEKSLLTWSGLQIGDMITVNAEKITDDEGNEKDLLLNNQMKIVGTVQSPLYLSTERGSTKLGSGKIGYYMYISPEAINTDIYTTAYITVEGAKQLETISDRYEETIEKVEDKIEEISEERKQARYNEIYDEASNKIKEAEETLNEEKEKADKEISDAQKKIDDAKKEIEDGRAQIEANRKKANTEFANAEKELQSAETKLNEQKAEFEKSKTEAQNQIKENRETLTSLQSVQKQYNTTKTNLSSKQSELEKLEETLSGLVQGQDDAKIEQINNDIKKVSQEIYVLNATITQIENNLTSQGISVNNLSSTITALEQGIKKAEEELEAGEQKINAAEKEIESQKKNLSSQKSKTYASLNEAEKKLEEGEKEIAENEEELEKAKKEADEKIKDAEEELEQAKLDLEDITKPEWYILNRNQNTGYASYSQDTDRIAKIATVFPVVFFVVAALISLTSMSRMVEEERVQIGTLKALGYTKRAIASKYIIYALSATLMGSVIGLAIGFRLIPQIITQMYAMMYTLPETILEFNIQYAIIGTGSAILCTVGATIYSCIKELKQMPASLMRPKAPKPGKRVLIENIKWIWSKMSFTQKVTSRNIFRYKKRFLMTIVGVAGCTALILAGFGLRDAVGQMIPSQYGEIFKYNVQISLKDDITTNKINEGVENITALEQITEILKGNLQSVEITNIENTQNIQLIIPENIENMSDFIVLRERTNRKNIYTLDNSGVIITEKLAKLLELKVGDVIRLKNSDDVEVETTIAGITENYLMHYVYMSPELYQSLYGEEAKINTVFANTVELTDEGENTLGAKILDNKDYISGVTFVSNSENTFSEVMENLNFVVWVLIIAAGLLAFVVLYNLSNTNISERIRELATIKVLGFEDKEVYDYVTREMNLLTLIGIVFGLGAGVFLTMYIIKTCEVDMFMFDSRIHWQSYIYAILITIAFALIVNVATYFALKKIDMIESLKSVE